MFAASAGYDALAARVPSRHLCLFACWCLELVGGSVYTYGIYSGSLKSSEMGLTQSDLDWCAFASNAGNYMPLAGMVYHRYGPRFTAATGGVIICAGYLGLWLVVSYPPGERALNLALAAMCCFVWGHGAGYVDAAAVTTSSRNFPRHRGRVLGLTKALYGLGSALLTQLYLAFLYPHNTTFILLLSLVCGALALSLARFLSAPPEEVSRAAERDAVAAAQAGKSKADAGDDGGEDGCDYEAENAAWNEHRLELCFWGCAAAIGIMLAVDVSQAVTPEGNARLALYYFGAALAVSYLAVLAQLPQRSGPLYVVIGSQADEAGEIGGEERTHDHTPSTPLMGAATAWGDRDGPGPYDGGAPGEATGLWKSTDPEGGGASSAAAPEEGVMVAAVETVGELVSFAVFWQLFATLLVGFGAGIMLSNNAGQIVKAAGGGDADTSAIVSLYSLCNGFGRLAMGRLADHLHKRGGVARTILAAAAAMTTAATFMLLSAGADDLLVMYAAFPIAGMSYGAFWTLSPTLVGDMFGQEILPRAYTLMNSAAMLGSLGFSSVLAPMVYEAHEGDDDDDGSDNECIGAACFRTTFLTVAAAALVATATGLLMHRSASVSRQ